MSSDVRRGMLTKSCVMAGNLRRFVHRPQIAARDRNLDATFHGRRRVLRSGSAKTSTIDEGRRPRKPFGGCEAVELDSHSASHEPIRNRTWDKLLASFQDATSFNLRLQFFDRCWCFSAIPFLLLRPGKAFGTSQCNDQESEFFAVQIKDFPPLDFR